MRYPDLEIDLLRAFVAVAETGGFTAASEVVGRSQSAVSQKVIRLEEIIGRRLFERTSRTLNLTRDGEQLLVTARRILELNDEAVRSMAAPVTVGSLRLGISDEFVPLQLPSILARFRRLYPGVNLDVMTGLGSDLLAAYDAGLLDVVITIKDGGIQRGRIIWREPLVWVASADFKPDFTKPAPLILRQAPCAYRDVMLHELDAVRREWVAVCTASSLMGVQAAVAGDLGVTVLGRSFVQEGFLYQGAPGHWPPLPMAEIVVIGEETAHEDFVRPLILFLTESLSGQPPRRARLNRRSP